jgi:DNA-binding MarR family transcriptional regulator
MEETLQPETLAAWRGVLFTQAVVARALEADMLEQHGLPITWFDLLGRLARAPGRRLRMHELEEASLFTRSGLTRLADRLEDAGLVRRERSAEDRRGVHLAITDAGLAKIDEVWPDHERSIQEHFGRYIDRRDAAALRRATQKVLDGLGFSEPLDDE